MRTTGETKEHAQEVIARCCKLSTFSEDAGATRRTFLCEPMRDCHRALSAWVEPLGMESRVDAAGNWRALYPARRPDAPRLLMGSHLDTVPNAGAYDGILGVVLAVALLDALGGKRFPFAIEVVGFSEEEGVRFGKPFIGSRALTGGIDKEQLGCKDADGVSVRQAIENFGLNPNEIPQAALRSDTLGYVEFHIEQGPVLDNLGLPLAAVEAIAGQSRIELIFVGRSNHAGTTPMYLRYDAVTAAAEWITAVERYALEVPDLVATVGKIEAKPGATNVIAGQTLMTLDIRHGDDAVRTKALDFLIGQAQEIAQRRGLRITQKALLTQKAVAMDGTLVNEIEKAIRRTGCEPHRMVSGAGHDAMVMAGITEMGMLFVRCGNGGISHHPSETLSADDADLAACAFKDLLLNFPVSP